MPPTKIIDYNPRSRNVPDYAIYMIFLRVQCHLLSSQVPHLAPYIYLRNP